MIIHMEKSPDNTMELLNVIANITMYLYYSN